MNRNSDQELLYIEQIYFKYSGYMKKLLQVYGALMIFLLATSACGQRAAN